MSQALIRHSSYLVLWLGFIVSLLYAAEFDLVSLATRSEPRQQRLHLDELLAVSTLFSMAIAVVSLFNHRLARRERGKRAEAERIAHLDALTSIANRRRFFQRLESAFARSRSGWRCAVILLDLDGFKAINDAYGHAAGDRVLMHVAREIDSLKGRKGLAARLGGDEFALVLEGSSAGRHCVATLIDQLRAAIARPVSYAGATFSVGASIGVAFASDSITTPAALLEAADGEMYRVKRRNRDQLAA